MIADIVTVFMNSARKKSANRIDEYSVWKPPTSSCSASTRSNGGRFSSAVPAITKMMNGTTPVATTFQRGMMPPKPSAACVITMSWVESEPGEQHDATIDEAEGRLVGDHLRRRADGAEQRVLRAGRPAGEHHAVDRDRRAGEDQQDADRRIGELQVGVVPEDVDGALLPSVNTPPIGITENTRKAGTSDRNGARMKTRLSARSGRRSSLKKNLMPSASVWRMPNGPGPVRAEAVAHVGVELALEPDHEQHGHEQEPEGDDDLQQDDQHLGEADATGEERVDGEHQAFTTRPR